MNAIENIKIKLQRTGKSNLRLNANQFMEKGSKH